ncbi:MAG: hypothetical protein RUDDFDWM_000790 [Candidatus Fervidibacterota bacterium]
MREMRKVYRAYFLKEPPTEKTVESFGTVDVEFASIRHDNVERICKNLLELQRELSARSIESIVKAIDEVASAWLRNELIEEASSALENVTGYSKQVIELSLRNTFERLRSDHLWQMMTEEIRDPSVLDGWKELPSGKRVIAIGPRLTLHILAGNIPSLGISSVVCALLTKSCSLVKVSSDEPILTPMFVSSLNEVDEFLASCCAVVTWKGGDETIESVAFKHADVVVAYGSMETIMSIRNRLPPTKRFIAHGHKISIGVVDSHCELSEAADKVATDVAMFDQQGCMSPHIVFVIGEREDAKEFVAALSKSLEGVSQKLTAGRFVKERAATIHSYRMVYTMAGEDVIPADGSVDWTVVLLSQPLHSSLFLNHMMCPPRTVFVRNTKTIKGLKEEVELFRDFLSSAGCIVCERCEKELVDTLATIGVSRICELGRMQLPSSWWHHDGRFNIADFLTWTEIETSFKAR